MQFLSVNRHSLVSGQPRRLASAARLRTAGNPAIEFAGACLVMTVFLVLALFG